MKPFQSLTTLAQRAVCESLGDGALAIDATAGNGHDTHFLASRVAPRGHVIGFDIQRLAIEKTRARLLAAGLEAVVSLHCCGHERMLELIPPGWSGRVSAAMFNLGYLPCADKGLTTSPTTTLGALDQALSLLRIGGLISLLVYRGHAGAKAEADAILTWLERLDARFRISCEDSPGPVLYLVRRVG